jgi:N-acetyl-gamma-glutamyl-phosphate reductase
VDHEQVFDRDSPRVVVAGASGFAGALVAHLLWRHPGFELVSVTSRTEIGQRLCDVPGFGSRRVPLVLEPLDVQAHGNVDVVVVAYPHAAAAPVVGAFRERGVRVVDLSADFRLTDASTYEQWYGPHPCPQYLDEAVYGLPEIYRDDIRDADLVANPGCFPTAALLALAPLAKRGLIGDVIVDAKTGVSGAGLNGSTATTHFSLNVENVRPYQISVHRHRPEIEAQLTKWGAGIPIQFQPHLVPMDQGKLSTCYVLPTREIDQDGLSAIYDEAYKHEPFIELRTHEKPPASRDMRGTNFCSVLAAKDEHTKKIIVFSAIDNLWKGSASQAVQNLNLMFGLPETTGIPDAPQQISALA